MTTNQSHKALNETVIANGYCVGCGVCAVPEQSPFKIIMDEYGQYQSHLSVSNIIAKTEIDYEKLCPFGANATSEDEIARKYFAATCEYNSQVGHHREIFAGHVAEGEFRDRGSSGGMGTWVLNELLNKGLVDYIIHVKSEVAEEALHDLPFKYQLSKDLKKTQQGGKSRYYPIELSQVLNTVRNQPGRYAVVGLPCFIKGIRLLQAQDPILEERIRYCVGLVCGHLKSAHYAESLAWQMGIAPQDLKAIDFRVKDPSQAANHYRTFAKGSFEEHNVSNSLLFGADWGMGGFKYKACDFCDDVFAETADVVLGDAWLPEYIQDSFGTNLVVTRNNDIRQLILGACTEGRLELENIRVEKAVQSQDAGLRHRKTAIGYRLYCEKAKNSWVPKKRVIPVKSLSSRHEMKRQRFRSELRHLSHHSFLSAKRSNDLSVYLHAMRPVYNRYSRHGRSSLRRLLSFIKRRLKIPIGR